MSKSTSEEDLEPPDDGVRRFRPGPILLFSLLLLAGCAAVIFWKVRERQKTLTAVTSLPSTFEEIRSAPAEPEPPSIHPLEGERRIFLADGCNFRYRELTFTRNFSEQHSEAGAVLKDGDPCLWRFEGVEGMENTYRIFCADPNFPEWFQDNLTYTRLVEDGLPQDDRPPYVTLRDDDYCEWKILKLSNRDQYEIYCETGSEPFVGESLGWMTEQEDLVDDELVTATLGENGNPSWWILPAGKEPEKVRRTSHLIITPRGNNAHMKKAKAHFEEYGREIFEVEIETTEDTFTRSAEDVSYVDLVKALRGEDPVLNHSEFPALLSFDPGVIPDFENLAGEKGLFPLVIPLKMALRPQQIRRLSFENTEFWENTWEEFEDFQSQLDESDVADGRVYAGKDFYYIFVQWDQ